MSEKNIHCTLTDQELAANADQWIDELIASGGKSWTMHVPFRPNADPDLIFAELNNRFKKLVSERPGPKWVKGAPKERKQHFAKVQGLVKEDVIREAVIWPITDTEHWMCVGLGFRYSVAPEKIIAHQCESPAEQPVVLTQERADFIREANNRDMEGIHSYPDLETEAREHAKTVTDNSEHQLYVAQGYYNAMLKKAEQPVREVDIDEFMAYALKMCWYDDEYRLWNTHDEAANPFRFTTSELIKKFKEEPAEWSGGNEGKPKEAVVIHNNSDAFRNWVSDIKGYPFMLLGHSTGVWLPPDVTLEMFESEWEAYEKANNPAKKEDKP